MEVGMQFKTHRERDAYLAGLIDGEGNVGVYGNGLGAYSPRVRIKMNCRKTIQWLCENYSGKILT